MAIVNLVLIAAIVLAGLPVGRSLFALLARRVEIIRLIAAPFIAHNRISSLTDELCANSMASATAWISVATSERYAASPPALLRLPRGCHTARLSGSGFFPSGSFSARWLRTV